MNAYEHTTVVLQFEKRNFALAGSEVLQGLARESARMLADLGKEGWELVSVLPYVNGGLLLGRPRTDSALGFFKRAKA